jgi:tyrosinase
MIDNLKKRGNISETTLQALGKVERSQEDFTSITKFWAKVPASPAEQPAIIAELKLVNPLWYDLRYPGEFPGGGAPHYPTPADLDRILAISNWRDFGGGLDVDQSFCALDMLPHNAMHIWIGGNPSSGVNGDMGNNLTAAFDPIFWGHHGNIDRLWARWQKLHPGVDPPDLSDVLQGVDSTVEDSLSVRSLGYEYAADTYVFPTEPSLHITKFASANATVRPQVLAAHRHAEVRVHGIRQPAQSFSVRVFLNQPDATPSTSIENNDHYAGQFALFGHGECIGGPGHCDPRSQVRRRFDKRPPHHNDPWNVHMDVTSTVQKLLGRGATDFQVNLVVVSPDGRTGKGSLRMQAVSLTFDD